MQVPAQTVAFMKSVTNDPVTMLLLINVILLFLGTFMDMASTILICTPIFLPIATQYGIHPVHLGIMMVFNMCIAVISPPSAPVLFVGARVAGKKVEDVIGPLMPFFGALIVMLLIVQYIPALSMWLPTVAGMVQPA